MKLIPPAKSYNPVFENYEDLRDDDWYFEKYFPNGDIELFNGTTGHVKWIKQKDIISIGKGTIYLKIEIGLRGDLVNILT